MADGNKALAVGVCLSMAIGGVIYCRLPRAEGERTLSDERHYLIIKEVASIKEVNSALESVRVNVFKEDEAFGMVRKKLRDDFKGKAYYLECQGVEDGSVYRVVYCKDENGELKAFYAFPERCNRRVVFSDPEQSPGKKILEDEKLYFLSDENGTFNLDKKCTGREIIDDELRDGLGKDQNS